MGIPERQCIGCGRRGPQREFIRLTLGGEEGVRVMIVAEGERHSGRGAYLCRSQACLERAVARKAFQRAFRASVEIDKDGLERAIGSVKANTESRA